MRSGVAKAQLVRERVPSVAGRAQWGRGEASGAGRLKKIYLKRSGKEGRKAKGALKRRAGLKRI